MQFSFDYKFSIGGVVYASMNFPFVLTDSDLTAIKLMIANRARLPISHVNHNYGVHPTND
jgi:hypothetical protein